MLGRGISASVGHAPCLAAREPHLSPVLVCVVVSASMVGTGASRADGQDNPGHILDFYDVESEIGRGTFGSVFRLQCRTTGVRRAAKQMPYEKALVGAWGLCHNPVARSKRSPVSYSAALPVGAKMRGPGSSGHCALRVERWVERRPPQGAPSPNSHGERRSPKATSDLGPLCDEHLISSVALQTFSVSICTYTRKCWQRHAADGEPLARGAPVAIRHLTRRPASRGVAPPHDHITPPRAPSGAAGPAAAPRCRHARPSHRSRRTRGA